MVLHAAAEDRERPGVSSSAARTSPSASATRPRCAVRARASSRLRTTLAAASSANLHDGAQQRLIALLLQLRSAQRGILEPTAAVGAAVEELAAAVKELRELAQGIHPSALSERGLAPALRIVAARAPVPVELDVTDTWLDPQLVGGGVLPRLGVADERREVRERDARSGSRPRDR